MVSFLRIVYKGDKVTEHRFNNRGGNYFITATNR